MKHTVEVSELSGTNESPVEGNFVVSTNRDFVNRHVVVGVSVLYNKFTGKSGVVSAITATQINTANVNFKPGDLFLVTLSTPWTIQNSDGPVIEVECNRCGFSYPQKELVNGKCKTCRDKSNR